MAKKIDDKKFIDLYLANTPYKEMARIFNTTIVAISDKRRVLKLPKRGQLIEIIRANKTKKQLIDFLRALPNPYSLRSGIPSKYNYALKSLLGEGKIIKIYLSFKRGSGGTGKKLRGESDRFFNEGFYEKTFYCLGRTGVVKLLMGACKKPKNPLDQHTLTSFLRSYLSHAERIAVLWHLGIKKFSRSQLKRNMQIDGIYFPLQYKGKYVKKSTLEKILSNLDQITED